MSQLPAGWESKKIKDVVKAFDTVDPHKFPQQSFTYIDISAIDNETQRIVEPKTFLGKDAPSRARRIVQTDDVLFSTVRTYLKNIAMVPPHLNSALTSTGIAVLRSNGAVEPEFLFRWVCSPDFLSRLNPEMDGTLYPAVTDKDVLEQHIPLPPIAEQRRIVARLDSLLAQSKAARAELNKALALAKRQRQAVLAKAFSGELTQDANFNGKVNALELYNSIREKNIQEGKKKLNHTDVIVSPPFNIPSSWMWTNIGALFDVTIGGTPSRKIPSFWNGDIPWVSSGEVSFQRIQDTREKISQEGLLNSNAKLLPQGTVLLGMIGEGKTRGQAAILDLPATSNQNAAAIMCSKTPIPSEWVYYWLQASYAITRGDGVGGVQPALNSERVRQLLIPLAPLEEQKEIVKRIEAAFAQIETMENEAKKALALAERLEQATLAKAFQGQL